MTKKKQSHFHYGEAPLTDFNRLCGPAVAVQSVKSLSIPERLDEKDVPFTFTRYGLRADWGIFKSYPDFRKSRLRLKNAVVLREWERDRVLYEYGPFLPFSEQVRSYRLYLAKDRLNKARSDLREFENQCRRDNTKQSYRPADPWELVDPGAVGSWLSLVSDCGGPENMERSLPLQYAVLGEDFSRMTDREREHLRVARVQLRDRLEVRQLADQNGKKRDGKVSIFVNVSGNVSGDLTGTGKEFIRHLAIGWAVAALTMPIKKTGQSYLMGLQNEQYAIREREKARDYITGAMQGGPVLGPCRGCPTGSGGMRYKIDLKATEEKGCIVYKTKKRRNSYGSLVSTGQYAVEDRAAKEVEEAEDRLAVGNTLYDLDAVINSCFVPAEGDIEKSFLFHINRDCVDLSDIKPIYSKFALWGANKQVNLMRSDYTKSKAQYIEIVSLDDILDTVKGQEGVPESYADFLEWVWQGIADFFPSCSRDRYMSVFRDMCYQWTIPEIMVLENMRRATAFYYAKKIRRAVAVFVAGQYGLQAVI